MEEELEEGGRRRRGGRRGSCDGLLNPRRYACLCLTLRLTRCFIFYILPPLPVSSLPRLFPAMATWRQFTHLLPSLSRYFRVVCFDAYGCGESPKPADVDGSAFSTDELFEDLKEVYDRFKGKGGNVLVGHSFGSSQVMRLAECLQRREGGPGHKEVGQQQQQQRQRQRQQPRYGQHEGAVVRGAMYPPFSSSSTSSSSSSILGLVLLASAYHVPDGGNPIFTLPLPVLNLIKPIISQVFKSKAIDAHAHPSVWKEQARGNQGS